MSDSPCRSAPPPTVWPKRATPRRRCLSRIAPAADHEHILGQSGLRGRLLAGESLAFELGHAAGEVSQIDGLPQQSTTMTAKRR